MEPVLLCNFSQNFVTETGSLVLQICQRTDLLEYRIVSEIGSLVTQTR
jgi:hypothetical protein